MGTLSLGELTDNDGTKVLFFADYSDTGQQRVNRVRVVNGTTKSCRVTLLDPATGDIAAQAVFLPNSTTQFNVNGQGVVVTEEGIDLPYDTRIQFPV